MAVDNTAIGSALVIPDSLLKSLDKVDEKIKRIQDTSKQTAQIFSQSFTAMAGNTGNLLANLQKVIDAVGKIGTASTTAANAASKLGNSSGGFGAAAQQASRLGTSITGVTEQINRMYGSQVKNYEQWQAINSQISQLTARQNTLKTTVKSYQMILDNIKNGKGGTIISNQQMQELKAAKEEMAANQQLLSTLRQKQQQLVANNQETQKQITFVQQLKNQAKGSLADDRSAAVLKQMSAYYKELEKSSARQAAEASRRAAAEEKARDREAKAAERAAAAAEKAAQRTAKAQAQAAARQTYANNTTYQGSLNYAEKASSINQRTQAIKYLTEARNALSKTDADYANKLATLNSKIKEMNAANRQAVASSQELGNSHRKLIDTAGQLQRAFALVFSVSQIKGYMETIANTRGYFELQQKSLQAILQNKTQADTIFNQTMALALDSPFRAKQLITYTKQLAAYRIENEKLYDTTKRLADVSAGLGVDMQRLILAYGQVKAAAYLRGTEVRQFTEAGINLYGELKDLFRVRDQVDYTTAQIVDMISKRQVTFEDVEQVFQRLTNEGGLFYNMQHIQVETLQGKIGKFKDAVDQMMNSIGKDNEGLLKGGLDVFTALVQNWEKVANVGKALLGVLALVKLYSIQAGVSMSAIFMANSKFTSLKGASALKMLAIGFKNVGVAAKTAGLMIKSAFMANIPMIAITAVLAAVYEGVSAYNNYKKAVAKANEELVKARGAVADLANEYKNLETATNNAQKVQERNNDPAKDIEARRNALQKLIDLANKEGLTLDIKVNEVKDEELDEEFNKVKEKYDRFLLDMSIIEKNHASNKAWNAWYTLSDDINEDADNYRNAVLEVLAQSNKLDVAIADVKANYDKLSEEAKKYYSIIAAGKKDGESQIDYYQRMHSTLLQIQHAGYYNKDTAKTLGKLRLYFKDVMSAAGEFRRELDDVLGEVIKNAQESGANEIHIKARINKYAAKQGWDDIKKDLAYQHFNIKTAIDKEEFDKEISWVDNYLTEYFKDKTYKIKFDVTQPTGADYLDDFIKKGNEASKAAKSWAEAEKRIAAVGKNATQIVADSNIAGIMNANPLFNVKPGDLVDIETLKSIIKEFKDVNADIAKSLGVDPFAKNTGGSTAQRDIWAERISVLKEMQARFEKLNELMGENRAIEETRSAFSGALKFTKMDEVIKAEDIIPTKQGMIDALEKLLAQIPNDAKNAAKKTGLEKEIAELKIGIQQDYLKEQLEKTKKNIDAMFAGLDLHQKLKDAGLTEKEVKQLFPGLAKSLDDVQAGIEERYKKNFPKGEYLKEGTDANEQYNKDIQKLNEERVKEQEDLVIELTKKYKTQLSDQLQLDKWYYEELRKIQENEQIQKDPELQKQLQANLDKQYAQKTNENTWKQFQNSDFYIRIFENLDTTSSRVLGAMQDKLSSIRENLKNLSPEQLKQVVEQTEKIENQLISKNPFKGLVSGIKKYINYAKQRKQIETEYLTELAKQDELEAQKTAQGDIVNQKQEEYDKAVEIYGANSEQAKQAEEALKVEKEKLDVILKELVAQGKITEEYANQIRLGEKQLSDTQKRISELKSGVDELNGAWGELAGMLETFGVEVPEEISGIMSGLSQTLGGLESMDITRPFSLITGSIKAIAGIGNTIGSIFGFGNKDKKLQKEIERQQEIVETLQRAYDKLKESMDNAWSATNVIKANDEAIENIKAQITSYQKMINAERDKKDTDEGKIKEWQNQIDDLKDTLKELEESMKEAFGGFGSEANYKSAAQEFADAWVDAFNETENTLDALNETFDDYFNNMLKKQLMQRAAQKYLQPIFDAFDQAVSEGSAGGDKGRDVTADEIAKIQQLKDSQLEAFDEYAKALMEMLGVKPNGTSTGELSKLQQGIQSLTESTGQALESLLNSIRFFVAQQTTDVSAIRALLQQSSSIDISASTDTPMLTELRAQTSYLRSIDSRLDKVIKISGHPKQGAGIKVFLD